MNTASAAAAVELCQEYLARMEARQLDAAAAMLAPGAGIVFPGGAVRTNVHEIAAGSARRYSRIGKHIAHWDVCAGTAPGEFIVYSIGTLHGAWTDGTPFQGIRYIDRFVVKGGQIVRQEVWNDAAEVKGSSPG
ncbi:MAG: nuclear transport factor 2 family protein [Alphaproteobacteria bacterium]|nr:nuclear transport factor 2 family protein [Alphaproteobacteria bacterium]